MTVQQPAPFQWQRPAVPQPIDSYFAYLGAVANRAELSHRNAKSQAWLPLLGLIPAFVLFLFLPVSGFLSIVALLVVSLVGLCRIGPTRRRMDEATGNLLRVQAGR